MRVRVSFTDAAPIDVQIVNQLKHPSLPGRLAPGEELPPILAQYPQARHVIEDCTHAVQIDRPELCVDLVPEIVTEVRARNTDISGIAR